MKSSVPIKPHVVNCDNGSAVISRHFREFLADRQVQLRFSPPYTPQLNSQIEAMWGTTFGTARVLLAAANLPPSMHPFAMQCARWIENRLPKPSRGNQSPVYMLSKALGDLSHLYTFGCLCLVTLPGPLRSGDKHFMDRGAPGLYLGPSEEGQCHLAYVFALRRVLPVAKIRVWEDEFPGLRGNKYRWFPDDPVVGSLSGWNQQRCALQRASWLCEWTSTGPQQFAAAYLCATVARRAFAPAPRRRLGRLKLGDQILVQRRVFLLHGMHLSLVLEDATLSHSLQCRVGVLWLHARSQG